jgi:hypothetical protein
MVQWWRAALALAAASATPALCNDPGDLLRVDWGRVLVGVRIEAAANVAARLRAHVLAQDDEFWVARARKQLSLTKVRMTFRTLYYDTDSNGEFTRYQLIPPYGDFDITFSGPARKAVIDGHELVVREYSARAFMVGQAGSARVSDPKLGKVGGRVVERFTMPVDPQLLVQRTGLACMGEASFPLNSIDEDAVSSYYDDLCEAEPPRKNPRAPCNQCHCTKVVSRSCVDALRAEVGRTKTALTFTRVAWDEATAASWEARNHWKLNPASTGADLVGDGERMEKMIVHYKYYPAGSCETQECVGGSGWRKVALFDTTHVNVGSKDLFIYGNLNYTEGDVASFDEAKTNYQYHWGVCHNQ